MFVWNKRGRGERKTSYSSLALLHVQPVLVKLDNVGVFNLHQVVKHLLNLLLENTHQSLLIYSDNIDPIRSFNPLAFTNKAFVCFFSFWQEAAKEFMKILETEVDCYFVKSNLCRTTN